MIFSQEYSDKYPEYYRVNHNWSQAGIKPMTLRSWSTCSTNSAVRLCLCSTKFAKVLKTHFYINDKKPLNLEQSCLTLSIKLSLILLTFLWMLSWVQSHSLDIWPKQALLFVRKKLDFGCCYFIKILIFNWECRIKWTN